jgi:hypothetical protein
MSAKWVFGGDRDGKPIHPTTTRSTWEGHRDDARRRGKMTSSSPSIDFEGEDEEPRVRVSW